MAQEQSIPRAGDSNHITRAYFDALLIETRYLDAVVPDTTMELYGETFRTPVMTAALSHLDRIYPESRNGMVETAKGAFAAGAVMWAGMGDDAEMEAMSATGARTIKIIKPYAEVRRVFEQIECAERCGALAVGMDIDHSFGRNGQPDHVMGYDMRPVSTEDLRAYIRATRLPFVVKGVLSVRDALKCAEAGARGIVVSHHHGITDYAIPPLRVLPAIAEALGGQMPIFVDCGIERGFDAFKAIVLGATAVSVGRAMIPDLVREGAEGVRKRIAAMTDELAGAMARTGSPDLSHIDPAILWKD